MSASAGEMTGEEQGNNECTNKQLYCIGCQKWLLFNIDDTKCALHIYTKNTVRPG